MTSAIIKCFWISPSKTMRWSWSCEFGKKTAVVRGHCCWVVASSSFLRTNKQYYYWFVQQAFFVRPKHLMLTCHMLIFECSWRTLLWSCWIFERFERKNQHKHYFRFVKPDKTWMCHMLFFPMVWRIMIYQSLDLHIVDATGVWTLWWKLFPKAAAKGSFKKKRRHKKLSFKNCL